MPAIHDYWLIIMGLAFALAMTLWLGLVFYAGRHPGGKATEHKLRGEVTGTIFEASEGGRQVMPDRSARPASPAGAVPGPRREPEQEPAGTGSRPEPAGTGAQQQPAGTGARQQPAGTGARQQSAGTGSKTART
jgi:hypothetical protein